MRNDYYYEAGAAVEPVEAVGSGSGSAFETAAGGSADSSSVQDTMIPSEGEMRDYGESESSSDSSPSTDSDSSSISPSYYSNPNNNKEGGRAVVLNVPGAFRAADEDGGGESARNMCYIRERTPLGQTVYACYEERVGQCIFRVAGAVSTDCVLRVDCAGGYASCQSVDAHDDLESGGRGLKGVIGG